MSAPNHEAAIALSERLGMLRRTVAALIGVGENTDEVLARGRYSQKIAAMEEEIAAIEEALIGDDPKVRAGQDWLVSEKLAEGEVTVLRGGNAHWAFVDFEIHGTTVPAVARYAIWRHTGAVYRVGSDGAVEDDPIHEPEENS